MAACIDDHRPRFDSHAMQRRVIIGVKDQHITVPYQIQGTSGGAAQGRNGGIFVESKYGQHAPQP
jgi:hypothetical protein